MQWGKETENGSTAGIEVAGKMEEGGG